ncbi:Cation-transporting P-type ATPase [Cynara cardunculus var. scolymus]|uniref:Phospholipid-transporting ATPase n=1 Tax=Cynara cardunculus var. scolymus TaxID=59895 RepID=A0A103XW04_CYNCS|nr:Cation-transporting P-type ATPase [Cynara cardunculus var. scolymus]
MAHGRIRAKIRRSSLYTFGCIRPPRESTDEPHQFRGPGYSRQVCCNQPQFHQKKPLKYVSNYISTTKYNVITFLPKALFEQFRRVANVYFLLAAALSLTPVSPFSAYSMIAPLAFVIGLSMAKEAVENWHRFMQDMKVNMRKVSVHSGDGVFSLKPWMNIRVGDVLKVEKDQFFPADLLLLSSSYEDGICYVETMNLDGETNLKVKRSLEATLTLDDDAAFKDFKGTIKCEDPNPNLYAFVGNLEYDRQIFPLDPSQILLRDSKLRNTGHVYGVVIFSGHDSKVMQNATKSPSKRSTIEKQMDKIIYVLFTLLVLISLISSIGFAIKTGYQMPNWWYMPQDAKKIYNPTRPFLSGCIHLITALILYGYLIPISLYVSIELVKVLQALFINRDIHMYDEETGTPAQARTSNLNEELGMVDTILSDKTGTLTCNQMDFLKCSIAGIPYGMRSSEVELAAASQMAEDLEGHGHDFSRTGGQNGSEIELETVPTPKGESSPTRIKGFSFEDHRLMNGNWSREPNADVHLLFFRVLALCHTAIPELNEETGTYSYEAESPDEGAFLVAAREVYEEATTKHLNDYGEAGLRTLALAYRKLEESEYSAWNDEFVKAKTAITGDREAMLERVPQCIDKLAQAGLKLWVLTGDKMETAINIGFSCSLLRQGMKQICITTTVDMLNQDSKKLEKDPHAAFALIIDGKMLSYALEDDLKHQFLSLAVDCASVICCRVSPKQKAMVTRLVKEGTGKTTLAIGDGANDVGMIQEADIGVGISGVEGMQAVMASDFSIAQFRFLERLLVVHGHWCYKRIAQMFPALYQQGPRNLFFDWYRIFGWMGNGLYCSLIVFFLNIIIFYDQAFRVGGQTADMTVVGTAMFTCVIYAVNCQIALTMSHFTWIQHFLIGFSIIAWYVFLILYGMLSPELAGNAYKIFVEALAPAPIFWLSTLLVTVACNLPYLAHISFQRSFNPMDHHVIQEIKYYKKDVEDRHMWTRERSKARQETKIGFSARVDAKIRHLRQMLQKKSSVLSPRVALAATRT